MKKNNKKGFTLVELVIVVAVMAVLVAIAIPTVSSITKSAQDAVNDSNARTIESIIKLAEAEASKAGDGTVALTEEQVANAVAQAKLGITNDTFYYNVKTGAVTTTSGTLSATFYSIAFGTDKVTVKGDETKEASLAVDVPTTAAPGGGSGSGT